ncbi:acyl carrier protein [Salinarimonas sp.]|uniref:acyl carrier protein n=1 Tax=Salinarimonas sp. TaxID=2766526 RepID=UPI0032D9106C
MSALDRTDLEAWLSGALHRVLRLPDPPAPSATLVADLGLTSLAAVTLQYRLRAELGLKVGFEALMTDRSIAALSDSLLETSVHGGP